MTENRFRTRGLLRIGVAGLHGLVLAAAVVVPGYAIFDAVHALFNPSQREGLIVLVDLGRWLTLLGNTSAVCGVAVLTAGIIGGLLGIIVARTDIPGRRIIFGAVLFGACVPVYVTTVVFFSLTPAYHLAGSAIACGLLYGLVYTPLAAIVLRAAFRGTDRELEEQALLNAGPWWVFLRVTMPQASWGMIVTGVIIALLVATDFTITDILLVRTFAEEAYSQYALGRRQAGPVLTALPVLITLVILLVTVQSRYRLFGENSPWQFGARPRLLTLGRWRRLAGVVCAIMAVVGLGTPVFSLLLHVDSIQGLGTALAGLQRELLTSAVLAVTGATLLILPAPGLAWSLARGGRLRWATGAAIVLLLAVPAPVVGISLIELLNRPGLAGWLYDSPFVIVIGYFVRFLPITVLLLIPGVQRVPREVEQAARVDGCDWLAEHCHIRYPAIVTDVAVVWLIMLILCFAELGTTVLLAPPGWATTSVRAFTLIHFGVYRDLAVLALAAATCILVPWLVLVSLLRWHIKR